MRLQCTSATAVRTSSRRGFLCTVPIPLIVLIAHLKESCDDSPPAPATITAAAAGLFWSMNDLVPGMPC